MLFLSDSPQPLLCSLAVRCWEFRAARSPLRGPTPTMMAPNKDCLPIFNKYHKYDFLSQDHQPIVSSCPTCHHPHTHFPPFPPGLPQRGHTSGSSARAPALCCLWGGGPCPRGLPRGCHSRRAHLHRWEAANRSVSETNSIYTQLATKVH